MKWIHSKSEAPKGPHFAIIEFTTVFIPGDERSRTNPGHGYPDSTEHKCDYIVFDTEEDWKAEIAKRTERKYGNDFLPVRITPATVKTKVEVEVS